MSHTLDCLVIGGGAAGLVAATYLARYRRRVQVVDAGDSRLQWIPRTRNVLGFPDGIAGSALWQRLREHAARYGVEPTNGCVDALRRGGQDDEVFEAVLGTQRLHARRVILCTGARDIVAPVTGLDEGLRLGQVRYCPVCDGFETQHQRVAVLGPGPHAQREALFVAGFDNQVTWLSMGSAGAVDPALSARLQAAGVAVEDQALARARCGEGHPVEVDLADGRVLCFDTLYAALGLSHPSTLATALGARAAADGQLEVDEHLQTAVPGLYAAGDVAAGLNQINVAAGQAAIAATAVHNSL